MKTLSMKLTPELEQWLEDTNSNFQGIFAGNAKVVRHVLTMMSHAYPEGVDTEWLHHMEELWKQQPGNIVEFPKR